MSDITKCQGTDCPIKERCYRYTAIDAIWQSWFAEIPGEWLEDGDFKCDMYWGAHQEQILETLRKIVKEKE